MEISFSALGMQTEGYEMDTDGSSGPRPDSGQEVSQNRYKSSAKPLSISSVNAAVLCLSLHNEGNDQLSPSPPVPR